MSADEAEKTLKQELEETRDDLRRTADEMSIFGFMATIEVCIANERGRWAEGRIEPGNPLPRAVIG